MRFGFVTLALCRLLYMVKANPKSFVYNRFKWCAQFGRNRPCPLQYIVIYGKRRSHIAIIASFEVMSRHLVGEYGKNQLVLIFWEL